MLNTLRRKSLGYEYKASAPLLIFKDASVLYESKVSLVEHTVRASKLFREVSHRKSSEEIYKSLVLFQDCVAGVCFNMIGCPLGEYTKGSEDEDFNNPLRHRKIVRKFLLGETQVTQELYQAVMDKNPSDFKNPQNPVERVTFFDAILFCNRLSSLKGLDECYTENPDLKLDWFYDYTKNGYRLPLDKEWEYAAKAGTRKRWAGTDVESDVGQYAVMESNSGNKTHDVKSKKPNEWGFYGMSGNVWEWCWDIVPQRYSMGVYTSRVIRGGGWCWDEKAASTSYRHADNPDTKSNVTGFRICRTIV